MPNIVPTKRCDLRCTHCVRSDYSGQELDLELLARFLADLRNYGYQTRQCLTGGEPTLFHDLDGLMQVFREAGMTTYIVTNGQNERGIMAVIRNLDVVDWISISLDGPNSELNDQTRGQGSFSKVLTAVNLYQSAGAKVDLRFVLHDRNAHTLDEIFQLAVALGIDRLRFSTLHPTKKTGSNQMAASFGKLDAARKRLMQLKKGYRNIRAGMNTRHMIPYLDAAWSNQLCLPIRNRRNGITLLPDGKVSFCCDLYDLDFLSERYDGANRPISPIVGNYSKESLETILQRKARLIEKFKRRRAKDARSGALIGPRQFICENCKFYCYQVSG